MTRVPRDTIKAEARARIGEVLRAIGIDVAGNRRYVVICNPVRGEKNPSLQIWLNPGFEGAWKDHGAQLAGDVFDLVAYFKGFDRAPDKGFAQAAAFLADLLGLERMSDDERRRLSLQRAASAQRAQVRAALNEASKAKRAFGLWLKGLPIAGTPVETYLVSRGIDIARLAKPPRILRYLPEQPHRDDAGRLHGETFPVMIAGLVNAEGRIVAVHRTWLARDGSGKADVAPSRKIWPAFAGCHVPLARGASGLRLAEANEAGIADDLLLTEGIEDGLSFALADPGPRVWAVGSLGNLASVPVPPCAASILVAVDNDWGKPEAARALQKGLDHLHRFGRPVVQVRSSVGKDANDLLRAG